MASAKQDNSPARLTTNSDYFPAFRDVPGDHIYDSRYYTDGEISHYKKNWCLIGEITEASTLMRPRLVVRDRNGASFVVALYLDKDVDASRILSKFKTGYTVALMYALGHLFLDGTTGVRIEDEDEITVNIPPPPDINVSSSQMHQIFPCKLDEFVKLNDDADRHNWFNGKEPTCHGCGKEQKKMNVCSGCRLVCYCSKVSPYSYQAALSATPSPSRSF